ncbi:ABC transporter permease [Pseudomonas sp. F1_0610]|uniref:ABC transporter permease n=1 Tax=Pseudomonas sp. F1_0610 TaxID=3114284 RepID=UPI0039C2A95A
MSEFWSAFKRVLLMLLDRPLWLMLLVSLLITSTVFIKQGVWDLPVAVVDQDHTRFSRELVRSLDATPKIAMHSYSSLNEAKSDLAARKIFAIVILPKNLYDYALRGEAMTIPIYGDATSRLSSGQIQLDIMQTYAQLINQFNVERLQGAGWSAEQAQVVASPMQGQLVDLFNPGINFAAIVFPGLLVMLVQHTLLIASIRVRITLHNLPTGRPSFKVYLGSVSALLPIWMFLSIVLFVLWPWVLSYRQTAPIWEILVLTLPFLVAVLALGKFLSECLVKIEYMYLTLSLVTTPVFYLSGTIWPLQSMPDWVRFISQLLPSTWATKMIAGVNQMGISIYDIGYDVVMLLVLALFYLALAFVIARFKVYYRARRLMT